MNKYIDAEKLKAEIKRRKQIHKSNVENGFPDEAYKIKEDDNILSLITSLQQEQPEVDLEKEIVSICETYGIAKNFDAELGPLDIKNIARHFYELGLNTGKV